jgi:hypothetical protein
MNVITKNKLAITQASVVKLRATRIIIRNAQFNVRRSKKSAPQKYLCIENMFGLKKEELIRSTPLHLLMLYSKISVA